MVRKESRKGENNMKHPFWFGAAMYPALEVAWRGRTHPSMALAGGMAMAAIRRIDRMCKGRPLWQRALLGGLAITGVEYAFGRVFNRRYQIWDYRKTPMNVQGQICLPFTLLWSGLSAAAMALLRR